MVRRSYSGNAPSTTLSSGINNSTLTIPLTSGTGYPAGGGAGPFYIVIDPGLAAEEKILCDSTSGNTITANASGRGADGTGAASHSLGAVVQHVFTKTDADEANEHINDTTDDHHTQYLNTSRFTTAHDVEARHAFGAALGAPGAATAIRLQDTAATGSGDDAAREDHTHAGPGKFTVPVTFAVMGDIAVAVGDLDYICPFFVNVPAGYVVKIAQGRHIINAGGTVTFKLQENGVDITNYTGQVASTTSSILGGAISGALTDEAKIACVVTSIGGSPKNLSVTLYLQYESV